MKINERAYALGCKKSVIREIFEYSKTRAAEIGAENVFDFSLGNPSVKPPEKVTKTILELLNNSPSTLLHGYTSAQGDAEVRKSVANHIKKAFGVNITENEIYMTCGAAASLTISLCALMNKGDECIVFAPFFTEYRVFIETAGGKVIVSEPDKSNFQIDIDDFEKRINSSTKAVILNSPNNPSGVVYTEETIIAVCEILEKKSREYGNPIYIIADEPYRELVYDNVKVPYLMNYYKNVLVCYSYSKSLSLPGERIGYIAVNPEADAAKDIYSAICGSGRFLGYVCAPSLFQQVIKKCVDINVDVNSYKENRDILYKSLTEYGFECIKPDGAFYLFVKSPENDADSFFEKAKKHEILFVPCDDFGIKGFVRIAYCVSKDKIINSLKAYKALAKEYGL